MIALCGELFAQLSLAQDQEDQTEGIMAGQVASLLETQISKEKWEENVILLYQNKNRAQQLVQPKAIGRQTSKTCGVSFSKEQKLGYHLCPECSSLFLGRKSSTSNHCSLHQALLITLMLPALNQARISFLLSFIALPSFLLLVQNVSRNIIKLGVLLDSCNRRTRGAVDI